MFSFVKIFFILIVFLFITSCHEKDYDIIRDFIMKEQQAKSSKKLDTLETDKTIKANVEITRAVVNKYNLDIKFAEDYDF